LTLLLQKQPGEKTRHAIRVMITVFLFILNPSADYRRHSLLNSLLQAPDIFNLQKNNFKSIQVVNIRRLLFDRLSDFPYNIIIIESGERDEIQNRYYNESGLYYLFSPAVC
jgi:hypothetical protein